MTALPSHPARPASLDARADDAAAPRPGQPASPAAAADFAAEPDTLGSDALPGTGRPATWAREGSLTVGSRTVGENASPAHPADVIRPAAHRHSGGSPTGARATVPPPGPQWYGSLMGTGIAATLTQTLGGHLVVGSALAVVLLVVGWAVFVGLTGAFALRIARRPAVFAETVRELPVLAAWGMVSMGVLSIGSATATVVPAHWPALTGTAWVVDGVLWSVGTGMGILTALGFAVRLIGREVGAPTTTWGLPIVPPMVSATTGAALVPHLATRHAQLLLVIVTVACFFLALVLGMVVFAVAYHHHWRVATLPLAAATSAWIPLGVVGQSTAAAQAIAVQAQRFVLPEDTATLTQTASFYGAVMLTCAVPLSAWAAVTTVRGFRGGMPFSPGWWALTFPIGTVCLGLHGMEGGTGIRGFGIAADAVLLILLCTWTLCTVATTLTVRGRLRASA